MSTSPGHIPLSALSHGQPTAIGELELTRPLCVTPVGVPSRDCADQLLLVRLHGDPVGLVHLDEPPQAETPATLATAIWGQLGAPLSAHASGHGCVAVPAGPRQLEAGLQLLSGPQPGLTAPRPPGRAAVIVATIGRLDALERALESLAAMRCEQFEVIVVDNRPAETGTRELVERLARSMALRYVAEPRQGLAIARNTGMAAAATAEFVAFTDDDVVVDPGWLSWLLAPFCEPAVQAVTGMVLPLRLDSAEQKRFEKYAGFGKGVVQERYDLTANRADDRLLYPFWGGMFGSGNSMAFRRAAIIAAGGFDAALGAGTATGGGEDIAAFTDVILGGGQLVYEPRSICWHEHRASEEALRRQVHSYGVGLTATLWRFAWRDPRFALAVARSVPVIIRLRRERQESQASEALPADLLRIEQRGRFAGPWRYIQSRRRLKRMGASV